MYLDDAVVSGVLIVALCLGMMVYVGHFAYRHIKEDMAKNAAE